MNKIKIENVCSGVVKYEVSIGRYDLCKGTVTGTDIRSWDSVLKILKGILYNIDKFKEFTLYEEFNLVVGNRGTFKVKRSDIDNKNK